MHNIHDQRLLIVDFGSQYTQLIARRVRECGVYCEIHPFDAPADFIREFQPNGIILSGGPETVTDGQTPRIADVVFELKVPVLGICYGMEAIAAQLGGAVTSSDHREFGHANIQPQTPSELLSELEFAAGVADVWMSHGDKVTQLPEGFVVTASTDSAPIAAMEDPQRHIYAVQFHPEKSADAGLRLLANFIHWNP